MNDVGQREQDAPKEKPQRSAPDRPPSGIFRDPAVRLMAYIAAGLVILFLVTVMGALITGVTAPTGPRTAAERDLMVASDQVKQGAVGEAYAPYINALVATGDVSQARVALAQARASAVGTSPVTDLDLAEARILSAEKNYNDAAAMAGKAMKGYQAQYDQLVARGGAAASTAENVGLKGGYYEAALVKAYADVNQRKYSDAVAAFDIYMKQNPTAADILVDRGNAKADMKDRSGAEKDFRAALKFVPYDTEAKAGLKKIGAVQ